jgi:hypothetical protein
VGGVDVLGFLSFLYYKFKLTMFLDAVSALWVVTATQFLSNTLKLQPELDPTLEDIHSGKYRLVRK